MVGFDEIVDVGKSVGKDDGAEVTDSDEETGVDKGAVVFDRVDFLCGYDMEYDIDDNTEKKKSSSLVIRFTCSFVLTSTFSNLSIPWGLDLLSVLRTRSRFVASMKSVVHARTRAVSMGSDMLKYLFILV